MPIQSRREATFSWVIRGAGVNVEVEGVVDVEVEGVVDGDEDEEEDGDGSSV